MMKRLTMHREGFASARQRLGVRQSPAAVGGLGVAQCESARGLAQSKTWRRPQRAFTLLELMVSVAILAIIIVGLLAMFNQVSRAFRAGTAQVDVMEGGRAAMGLLVRDLQEMTATGLTNLIVVNGAGNVIESFDTITNFYAMRALNSIPTTQDLAGGGARDNELMDLSFMTRINDEWIGVAYRVNNAVAGVGTLYRLTASTKTNETSVGELNDYYYFPTNVGYVSAYVCTVTPTNYPTYQPPFINTNLSRFHRIIDGVVHLSITAYDTNGTLMTDAMLPNPVNWLGFACRFQNATNRVLPAYVEVELGVLEPATTAKFNQRVESNPTDPSVALTYLKKNVGKVHLFRQRVSIRSAATSLGPGT